MRGVGWDEHVVPLMVRAPFDPRKHPRGPGGRFIMTWETGRLPLAKLPAPGGLAKRDYDQADLVASVRKHGVREPVAVMHDPDGLAVVNGKHRLAAAHAAGVADVPVIVQHAAGVNPRSVPLRQRRPASYSEFYRAWKAEPAKQATHGVASKEELDAAVVSSTGPEQAVKAARAYTRSATMALGDILGTGQRGWNGKVNRKTRAEFGDILGANEWDGSISYRDDVLAGLGLAKAHRGADVDPQPFYVVAHEGIHSEGERHIPHPFEVGGIRYDWTDSEVAYQHPGNAHLEEGFTELGTLQHAPELFDRMGVGDRTVPFQSAAPTDAYYAAREALARSLTLAHGVAAGKPKLTYTLEHAQIALSGDNFKPAWAAVAQLRVLGGGDANWLADNIEASIKDLEAAPKPRLMTLKEYATYTAGQDIGWGHYPEFQAAALGWLYDVAYAEGSTAKTPLDRRIVALADEVNRVGTDQKTAVMARQLFRAAKLDGTDEDVANLGAQIANEFTHAGDAGFDGGKVFRRLTAEWAAKLKHSAVTR